MSSPPRILLFGAGSIGAVYIYQFQKAGCKVTAVCRSNYDAVKRDGFTLRSEKSGTVQCRPDLVVKSVQECPQDVVYDFVFVTAKSFPGSSPSLSDMLRPAVQGRPQTIIVLAQNGIGIEDEVAEAYPDNPVLSCVVYLPATQIEQGVVEYREILGPLEVGTFPSNAPPSHKAAANTLASLMRAGGGQVDIHDNIQIARWGKILMNCAWNPICALSMCADGEFLNASAPYAEEMVWAVMKEIIELAKKIGIPDVTEQVASQKLAYAKQRAATNSGRELSMLHDIRKGRLFEVEAIVGNTVRLGRQHGVQMPMTEMLYALTKARFHALVREQTRRTT